MTDERLDILFDRYFDGALSEADRAELERALLSSPDARAIFWDRARLHADATQWGQEEWGRRMAAEADATPDVTPVSPARPPSWIRSARSRRAFWWVATGMAACVGVIVFLLANRGTGPTPDRDERLVATTTPAGVAVLASTVDATWAADAPGPGAVLSPGKVLNLSAGAAQVEFFSGARLIVQGPAEVEVRSEMEVYCRGGRVTALVPPPARGFKVSGDRLTVVDLGTEFGVSVPPTGPAEVHVFGGVVEVYPSGATTPAAKLSAGEGGRVTDRAVERIRATPLTFVREADYAALTPGDERRQITAWRRATAAIDQDPATLAHYMLSDDGQRTVPNAAAGGGGSAATIVGCAPADGRWPGARAVEFRGPGDRVRLDVGGGHKAVTLLAWVRLDSLPNTYHALLAPDGLAEGALRWGVTREGELRLGIARRSGKPEEPKWEVIMSGAVVTPERLGRWAMLASTFDGKEIRHYVDGELVKAGDAFCPSPVSIGPADVGNGRGPEPRFVRGRMDELAIVGRALAAREVKELYDAGWPTDAR
ncbi:MAG: LamG-like jellyroll fold domain-containing protein [Phycisphaerae bacterium]